MICPKCHRPYLFINEQNPVIASCLRCDFSTSFEQPSYNEYHVDLYLKPYRRDRYSDPQMLQILKFLEVKEMDVVLDLGCGVGDYTNAIGEYTQNITGLDLSVTAATKKFPDSKFLACDLNASLPFAEASVDAVVSVNLIEHLVNAQFFVAECARILKRNGKIAMTTANLEFILHRWFYDKTHVHEWSLNQFKEMLLQSFNLSVIEKSSSMFNYYPMNKLLTKVLKPDLIFLGTKK